MTPIEAVKFMRENKVITLRTPDGLEVQLDPASFQDSAMPLDSAIAGGPDMDEVGSRGMSRRQQIELFDQIFEDDFRKRG